MNLKWDAPIPSELVPIWNQLWSNIKLLEQIRIPRYLGFGETNTTQLHGFCDASAKAYGAIIYARGNDNQGNVQVRIIATKSRIAPIKDISIPRLELSACELLSNLYNKVARAMQWEKLPAFFWCDSTVALHWLQKDVSQLKVYVGNRVKNISANTNIKNWSHVRTEQNPADLISRGLQPAELVHNHLWFNGPAWLKASEENWPKLRQLDKTEMSKVHSEEKQVCSVHSVPSSKPIDVCIYNKGKNNEIECVPIINYSNDVNRILRILSYVFRFIENSKQKRANKTLCEAVVNKQKIQYDQIELPTETEKESAMFHLIKREQMKGFITEYNYLLKGKLCTTKETGSFPKQSKIINLCPIMDENFLIRVGGRIDKAEASIDKRHPVLVPLHSRLCYLLLAQTHEMTHHGSVQVMMQAIREKYWIPRLRSAIRMFLKKCLVCALHSKKFESQLMSDLPADRVNRNRAFLIAGLDYAGPFDIAERYKRKTNLRKCWVAVFVCMVTRAIHLDVITDLTSAAFIACYERFICRRGHCNKIYSDNGTTFRGASNELQKAFRNWSAPDAKQHLNKKGTQWRFAPPAAPHQGGIYEAAVKSMKHHLVRIMGKHHYTYEYFVTLLVQIEAILNSRPLYPISDDPMDTSAITPAHFLIGESFIIPPPIAVPSQTNYSLKRIRDEQQKMIEHFWRKWNNEFLTTMLPRKKWFHKNEHFKEGLLVAIYDENLPPAQWLLGRITALIQSADGLIRAVEIKTTKSKLVRPIQKICLLPTEIH